LGLELLRSQFPRVEKSKFPVPVVLKNQLYALVSDRTEVDRELEQLKREGKIRSFNLRLKANEFAFMFVDDYIAQVEVERRKVKQAAHELVFDAFMKNVLPATRSEEYIEKERLRGLLFPGQVASEEQLWLLVHAGLLIRDMRPEIEGYWFSVPNIGAFVEACIKGRKEVALIFKRQKHQELLQESIKQKLLRSSSLGPLFHVRDLIGQGVLESISTTAGLLLRLVK